MTDQKLLITKLVRTENNRADLYAKGHQYRDAILFDLSDLAEVDIDYEALVVGRETPCRFWAHFELSDRDNQNGNPYKDITLLEPIGPPAPTAAAAPANDAILAELRAIRAVLVAIADALSPARGGRELPSGPKDAPALDLCPDCNTRPCICDKITDSQDPATSSPEPEPEPPTTYADGSAINDNDAERVAFRAHVAATNQAPADVAALRDWVKTSMPPPE